VLEDQETSKSGAPTLDGGNSSSMKVNSSQISRTIKFLMSLEEKMRNTDKLLFTRGMVARTRDGRSYILMKLKQTKKKELARLLDSISIDHSTSDQDFQ
jgi:hypothetical protein